MRFSWRSLMISTTRRPLLAAFEVLKTIFFLQNCSFAGCFCPKDQKSSFLCGEKDLKVVEGSLVSRLKWGVHHGTEDV